MTHVVPAHDSELDGRLIWSLVKAQENFFPKKKKKFLFNLNNAPSNQALKRNSTCESYPQVQDGFFFFFERYHILELFFVGANDSLNRHAAKLDFIIGCISENLNQKNHMEELVEQEEDSMELVESLTLMLNNFMKKS
jgi:hypothetical protein